MRFFCVQNIAKRTGIFVIFGRSHKYEVTAENDKTCLNPGSCGPRRFLTPAQPQK